MKCTAIALKYRLLHNFYKTSKKTRLVEHFTSERVKIVNVVKYVMGAETGDEIKGCSSYLVMIWSVRPAVRPSVRTSMLHKICVI